MISRAKKEKQVQELSEKLKKAQAGFLISFKGLKVSQATQLRKELNKDGLANMQVCRNTAFKKALELAEGGLKEHFSSSLSGSNAFVFAFNEPSKTAKILSHYVKETEKIQIKTGVLNGKKISSADIKMLADLPPIDVLRGQMLRVLSAPLSQLLLVFSATPKALLQLMSAYKDKKKN